MDLREILFLLVKSVTPYSRRSLVMNPTGLMGSGKWAKERRGTSSVSIDMQNVDQPCLVNTQL